MIEGLLSSVQKAITDAQKNLQATAKNNRTLESKAGFIAEEWHTSTFNIDAAANKSNYKAERPQSTAKASSDVVVKKKGVTVDDYGMKYYKNGTESAKAQSKTIMQNYKEYVAKAEKNGTAVKSFSEYLDDNVNLKDAEKILNSEYASEYAGQNRLIPADQMDEAKKYLRQKVNNEKSKGGTNRSELAKSYQETLDKMVDKVSAKDGTQSIPLTEEEAKLLAEMCEDDDFNLEDFKGVKASQVITPKYVLKQSISAGTQAAALEVALAVGPELFAVIGDGIKKGYIDEKQLKDVGVDAAFAGANGFVEGSVSAAIITACQAGKLGAAAQNLSPDAIGTLTVITIDAIKYGYKLSNGEINTDQYGDLMAEEIFVALVSNASGAVLGALLPGVPVAFLVGSLIGGMIASAAYESRKEVAVQVVAGNGFEAIIPTEVSDVVNIGKDTVKSVDLKKITKDLKNSAVSTTNNGIIKIKASMKSQR